MNRGSKLGLKKRSWKILFVCAISGVILSCVHEPTKTYTSQDIDTLFLEKSAKRPIEITNDTIIIDARKPFDFAVTHYPQAVNFQWTDFTDITGPFGGRLKSDLSQEILRLSLAGISPASHVVVVGNGLNGNGEEGRLAWTLAYMGLFNVQVSDVDSLGLRYSNIVSPPRPNAKKWEPQFQKRFVVSKKDVMQTATSKRTGSTGGRVHILDVRSKDEYFAKNRKLEYDLPDLRAINIEWRQFFGANGRPSPAIKSELEAIRVKPRDEIIVICDNGSRSGAVAFALLSMGYKNTKLYPGGYAELLDLRKK